jgi:hypothetical protein
LLKQLAEVIVRDVTLAERSFERFFKHAIGEGGDDDATTCLFIDYPIHGGFPIVLIRTAE